MSNLDIEKIIDMVVGAIIGMVLLTVVLIGYHYLNPHQCSSPKAYTLEHETKTSDGFYRYEMHRFDEPVGMLISGIRIEHGFMINTNVTRHVKQTKSNLNR